jgi:hypothetical protein
MAAIGVGVAETIEIAEIRRARGSSLGATDGGTRTMNTAFHVVPQGKRWAVRRAGASRVLAVFDYQIDAQKDATDRARSSKGELIVHGRGGKFRLRNSYGGDPRRSKG